MASGIFRFNIGAMMRSGACCPTASSIDDSLRASATSTVCPSSVNSIKSLSVEQLDFLLDDKANTIGALAFHLAATDAFYHEHTFKNIEWGKWDQSVNEKFGAAMELGDEGRKKIKGNNAQFYIDLLQQTRESTLAEFKKRDDKWLMTVDEKWYWGPTNNYCKWFHVTEHESHHLGQMNLLKSRLPGAKAANNG